MIGQERALKEIKAISNDIKKGYKFNILIIGKSGYGKNTLATQLVNLSGKSYILVLGSENIPIDKDIIIIDEAHLMKTPETIYQLMDEHTKSIIILTTELGKLPEALTNRCIIIQLVEYSKKELTEIAKYYGKNLPNNLIKEIVSRCRGVPRNIFVLIERINISIRNNIPVSLDSYGVYENGYTDLDYQYLDILEKEGVCSLNTLCKFLNLPKETIENNIEPFLLRNGRIKVTPKGREIC